MCTSEQGIDVVLDAYQRNNFCEHEEWERQSELVSDVQRLFVHVVYKYTSTYLMFDWAT